ncbi:LytTR family DNA-binding domain-containing protein, partial [Ruminococcaceae bacterium OttesenSCG-928-D13]|nr:LytTR family DNA-binding domain-containing protein [Ruminococcaceae bacterium OttesenSCG-928-D13]
MIVLGICDDEAILRHKLKQLLEIYSYQHNIDFHYVEVEKTSSLFLHRFDILFLDIRFDNKNSGIMAAKKLRKVGYSGLIIFLTSYPDFSIQGYEAEAFRYLVKPITEQKLTEVMDAAISKLSSPRENLHIQVERGLKIIPLNDIILIESMARQRRVVTENEKIITWDTLLKIYDALPHTMFAYPHRSFIVNYKAVSQIKNMTLYMNNGTAIPIGRKYRETF